MHKPIDIAAGKVVPPVGAPCSVSYGYTFGGHKFLKETELEGETPEVRLYLGGAEFVNGQPESYYHGEGRVALTDSVPRFQYKLTDHLGNTMVLFEDRDGDGIITTESNPAENEVLQRNFYYAFGLPMQGPWNHTPTDPDMPYLYNGKELEGELGLGWYAYGFRYYDASIGRFVGVDPISSQFPHVSVFNYAENEPVASIDLHGLQRYMIVRGNHFADVAFSVDRDRSVIDATWAAYHKLNPDGALWRNSNGELLGLDGVVWKKGHAKYVDSRNSGIAYKGTLFMDITDNGVEMSFLPDYEPKKVRGGLEVMTGIADKPGSGSMQDEFGTSTGIIDDMVIPFGGGGGKSRFTEMLNNLSDWAGSMGNVSSDRAPYSIPGTNEMQRTAVDSTCASGSACSNGGKPHAGFDYDRIFDDGSRERVSGN
jgi:RHS repeat-associated protein